MLSCRSFAKQQVFFALLQDNNFCPFPSSSLIIILMVIIRLPCTRAFKEIAWHLPHLFFEPHLWVGNLFQCVFLEVSICSSVLRKYLAGGVEINEVCSGLWYLCTRYQIGYVS